MRWGSAVLVIAIALLVPNCHCGSNPSNPDSAFVCNPPCVGDRVCRYDVCVPPPMPCTVQEDCKGDSYCDVSLMECLPWGVGPGGGSNPECKRDPVPGVFFPGAQCEWTAPAPGDFDTHRNVLATPVV